MIPTLNCYSCEQGCSVVIEVPCATDTNNPFGRGCGVTGATGVNINHFKFPGAQNIVYDVPIHVFGYVQTLVITGGTYINGFFVKNAPNPFVARNAFEIMANSGRTTAGVNVFDHYILNRSQRPPNFVPDLFPMDYQETIQIVGGSCVYIRWAIDTGQLWNRFAEPDCAAYPSVCAIRPPRNPAQSANAVPPLSTNNTVYTGQFLRIDFDCSVVLPDP